MAILTNTLSESAILPIRVAGEPDWLNQQRRQAWELYQDMPEPLPAQRNLRKYAPMLWLEMPSPAPQQATLSAELQAHLAVWNQSAGQLVHTESEQLSAQLSAELNTQGVFLGSWEDALQQIPEVLKTHFGEIYPATESKQVALNTARWQYGFVLYVPRNVVVPLPLYVLQTLQQANVASFTRGLVIAERGAQVTLVQEQWSAGEDIALNSHVLEIDAAEGSQVQVIHLQQWGSAVQAHSLVQARLKRDAQLRILTSSQGGSYHHAHVGVSLVEPGAHAHLLGINLGKANQYFYQDTHQNHLAPRTESHLAYHTVLTDKAYSFFNGLIRVPLEAQQTVSNQVNKNLLLSDGARADTMPNLEIVANDVQCSHGAAIGNLDPEQKFYLMSRGFDEAAAEKTILQGFVESILVAVPSEELQAGIRQTLGLYTQDEE